MDDGDHRFWVELRGVKAHGERSCEQQPRRNTMADRAVAGSAFKYAVTDSASDDRFAAVRQSLANASGDDDSNLDDEACAKLLANHQARELVEHLLQAASGGGHRIVHRQSLHQLLQLLRKLPDAEQAAALRRLRRLVSRRSRIHI